MGHSKSNRVFNQARQIRIKLQKVRTKTLACREWSFEPQGTAMTGQESEQLAWTQLLSADYIHTYFKWNLRSHYYIVWLWTGWFDLVYCSFTAPHQNLTNHCLAPFILHCYTNSLSLCSPFLTNNSCFLFLHSHTQPTRFLLYRSWPVAVQPRLFSAITVTAAEWA